MPRSKKAVEKPVVATSGAPTFRVLLVDDEPQTGRTVTDALRHSGAEVIQAATLADARQKLGTTPIDLALIKAALPDGSGLALANDFCTKTPGAQAIVIADKPTVADTIEAMRHGASDVLTKPLAAAEVSERVTQAIARRRSVNKAEQRIQRLRRICKKLNAARDEVSQQVDILCNDLVTAYQELATQMNQVAQTSEFVGLVRDELDLEHLLRRTLEYLLQKAGPMNAAIFLPSSADEYTLGGYVNYDCTAQSADILLQHLADVVAPKIAAREAVLHITDNATLAQWIGDDSAYLADSHVIAFACSHQKEPLAVVTLFRDGGQPFEPHLIETCAAMGPLVGEYLAKIIRIHHRGSMMEDEEEGNDSGGLAA